MVEIIPWPVPDRLTYLRPFIQNVSREAGANMHGVGQIITPGAQFWRVTMSLGVYSDPGQIKAFEALVSEMRGRENIAALELYDGFGYDATVAPDQEPFSDGSFWSDGTGILAGGTAVEPVVVAKAALAGTNQLDVSVTNPARTALRRGDLFSHNGYLYRVVRRTTAGWIKFEPDARADIPVGAVLKTDPPVIYCRFVDGDQGARGRGKMSRGEEITLEFEEAFDR